MSGTSAKLVFGPKILNPVPKVSLGRYLFDRLKQANEEDIALVDAHTGHTLSYGQILQRSVQLAYHFRNNNVKKGDAIAILSENDINYIIPVLAAAYVGAIVHHLSILTLEETSEAFAISQPKWLFSSESAGALTEQLKYEFPCIHTIITFGTTAQFSASLEELVRKDSCSLRYFEPDYSNSEDVAEIFCSSGTSGLPKCVMLTNYNMMFALEVQVGYRNFRNIQQGDTVLLPIPITYIYGFQFLLGTLAVFGKCIIMKKFIPKLYLKSIELHKVTTITCPPPLLNFLAESALVKHYDVSSVINITYVPALFEAKIEKLIKNRFNVSPRQVYGTTETAGDFICTPPVSANKAGSCGIVAHGLVVKVCNIETQEILGSNQPGEICIKGPVVMKGYMVNPEATKSCIDTDGFYHTGEIGYYDEDQYFFIVDSLKDTIKYKGYQVSSTELENLILRCTAVTDVSVIGILDQKVGEIPLAYVVINKTCNDWITAKDIIDFVAERISVNKRLYGGVKFVKEIPKNINGNVSKRTLREMYKKSLAG